MSGEEKVGNSGQEVGTHKKCLKAGQFCANQYGENNEEESGRYD